MRYFFRFSFTCLVACGFFLTPSARAQTKGKLAVLPFHSSGVDSISAQTIASLLRKELDRSGKYEVIEGGGTPNIACEDLLCATNAVKFVPVDRIVYGSISKLGSKVIMDYSFADVRASRRIITGSVSAETIEGLQYRIEGVSSSIINEKPISETGAGSPAVVPNRVLNKNYDTVSIGGGFGQLYPQKGYAGSSNRVFVLDARASLEHPNYTLNFIAGIRYGLFANFGASYVPINGPISPYIGAGIGYHLTVDELSTSSFDDPNVSTTGFNGMISAGIWFFRKSTLRFYVNVDYMYTATSYDDQALVLTLGVVGITDSISF